jgi:hypothetical protein
MKKETVITMDYGELDEMVTKTYNFRRGDYEFIVVEECGNDSSHRFSVEKTKVLDPTNALDKWDLEKLEKIKTGNVPSSSNHVIMQDLVNRGVLEPGIYIIEVSW